MPLLRSGFNTNNVLNNVLLPNNCGENKPIAMPGNASHQLFRSEYDAVILDAKLLFPSDSETEIRESFLAKKCEELLIRHGFLARNQPNLTDNASVPVNAVQKSSLLVKNFVATCNKYDEKVESMNEFFDRFERKLNSENVDDKEKLNILEILLPGSFFQLYENSLTHAEQFLLYKKRALIKAKCTPIDILFKTVNSSFDSQDSFNHIFDKTKFSVSKCKEAFPSLSWEEIAAWVLFLKGIPKGIRLQMTNECRPDEIDELQPSIQRFASSRSCTIGSFFTDFKSKPSSQTSNSSQSDSKTTSASNTNNSGKSTSNSKPSDVKTESSNEKCSHCSKTGHKEENCWAKYPEKNPKNKKNINHAFCTNRVPYKDGVEFIMEGKLNKKHTGSSDILLDSGAGVSAINSKFCSKETKTGETMTVSSLKYETAVGSYPVVQVQVETLTFKGLIEDVSVKDLKHDAILPAIDQGNGDKILLDPRNASVTVIHSTTSDVESVPAQLHDGPTEITSDSADSNIVGSASDPPSDDVSTSSDQENVSNRMQSNAQSLCSDLHSSLPKAVTSNLLKSSQCTDIECRKISNYLRTNESMFVAPQVELIMYNDLICKVNKGTNSPYAIYVPQNLTGYFLKHYHDDSGHLSYTVVAKTISQNFYFPNMFKVIQDYVNKCGVCQFDTTARFHKPLPSDLIELTDVPFAHICIDFVTHFQTSYSGTTYLLAIVDVATRFANAIPVKTLTAEECLDKLINFHFYKYGFPKKITSDNGRQFLSKLFTSYCKDHAIELINTSPRHLQSNGICEIFNGTFSDMIKHSSLDEVKSWDELINKLLFTYNNSVRSSTKFSPSELVFSYQVNDLNSRVDSPTVDKVNVEEFVVNTRLNSEDDRRQAHVTAVDSQIANKTRLDPLAKAKKLNVGDKVFMKTEPNKKAKMKLRVGMDLMMWLDIPQIRIT